MTSELAAREEFAVDGAGTYRHCNIVPLQVTGRGGESAAITPEEKKECRCCCLTERENTATVNRRLAPPSSSKVVVWRLLVADELLVDVALPVTLVAGAPLVLPLSAVDDAESMCDLVEASSYGSCFTWWNGRRGESTIWIRLDMYLYTLVWESIFRIFVRHLSKATFDHSLLLISCELISPHVAPKHFVFLNLWTKHDDFFRVVQDSWIEPIDGAPMFVLATKVLGVWSKGTFGDIFVKLKECEDKVQALEGILQ
nr:uncharacterized protein LOC109193312 [Ipomoea trifida]